MKKIIFAIFIVLFSFLILLFLQKIFGFSYWAFFVEIQKLGNKTLYDKINQFREGSSITTIIIIFLISFLYGLIHASGPGHGKVIVANYFIENTHPRLAVFKVAFFASIVHTGSAIALAILFRTLLSYIHIFERITIIDKFRIFSGAIVFIMGVVLLIKFLFFHTRRKPVDNNVFEKYNMFFIAILAGIIPCPISMNIMLISISMEMFYIGIIVVTGVSLGMFLLLYIVGSATLRMSNKIVNLIKSENKIPLIKLTKYFGIIQAIFFIFIGLFMIRLF